jgi:hypothetical protein
MANQSQASQTVSSINIKTKEGKESFSVNSVPLADSTFPFLQLPLSKISAKMEQVFSIHQKYLSYY